MSLFKKLALATVTMVVALGVVGVISPMTAMAQTPTAPIGYEKISGPSKISQYTDVIKFSGSDDLFGKPRSTQAANTVVRTVAATTASTASNGSILGNSSLGNLLILDSIFGGNNTLGTGILGSTDGSNNLGNLFLLNELFGGDTGLNLFGTGTTGTTGNNSLGNLLILNSVFGGNSNLLGNSGLGTGNLGNLIILDKLFGGGM
ncbi:MAG: hypothetical protein WCV92_01300 [Candidatus Buchananbacteria bacterium]